jgi:hypothetical protein
MSENPTETEWWKKPLSELSDEQWEALCDGCGKCCLHKLQDEETDEVFYTEIACRLLDLGSCKCSNYLKRWTFVPDCIGLSASQIGRMSWLPSTCAYRLRNEGKDLPWWHPLVSGDPETVHQAGISVRGRCVPEQKAGHPEDHIVTWPE